MILNILVIVVLFYAINWVMDEWFEPQAQNIAWYYWLSQSVAGATLLSIWTSIPEISTAILSLFMEWTSPALWVWTIVGSAIFQLLVVIWFIWLVRSCVIKKWPVIRDSISYLIGVGVLYVILLDWVIGVLESWLLVSLYLVYLLVLRHFNSKELEDEEEDPNLGKPVWRKFIWSLAVVWVACYFLILQAESLAVVLWVPSVLIALTVLAWWSSIPELVASYTVAKKGKGDMAIANAIGSNIFDILVSLWLPMLIYTLLYGSTTVNWVSWLLDSMLFLIWVSVLVLLLLFVNRFRLWKVLWVCFIALYIVYVLYYIIL